MLVDKNMKFNSMMFYITTSLCIIGVFITQYFLYQSVSEAQHNGNKNTTAAIYITLITNTVYVGSVIILLKLLPGFKQPFSNTFGYLVVYLFGVKYANRLLRFR